MARLRLWVPEALTTNWLIMLDFKNHAVVRTGNSFAYRRKLVLYRLDGLDFDWEMGCDQGVLSTLHTCVAVFDIFYRLLLKKVTRRVDFAFDKRMVKYIAALDVCFSLFCNIGNHTLWTTMKSRTRPVNCGGHRDANSQTPPPDLSWKVSTGRLQRRHISARSLDLQQLLTPTWIPFQNDHDFKSLLLKALVLLWHCPLRHEHSTCTRHQGAPINHSAKSSPCSCHLRLASCCSPWICYCQGYLLWRSFVSVAKWH